MTSLVITWFLCFEIAIAIATSHQPLKQSLTNGRPFIKSRGEGGYGGSPFDDFNITVGNATIVGVHSINISSERQIQIDSFQVTYLLSSGGLYTAPRHGKTTTPPLTITLARDEYIEKIEGKTNGDYVDQLTITILDAKQYQRRVHGPYGKTGMYPFSFEGYIVGFFGSSGSVLDNLGVHLLTPTKTKIAFTSEGGENFDDNPDLLFPPVIRISKLFVHHGDSVDSIQAEYQLLGGGKILAKKHGGDGGGLSIVSLDAGESIIGLECKTRGLLIDQLTFTTRKENGTIVHYGPFGKYGTDTFSLSGNVIGLIGTENNYCLKGIGAYYF